MKKVLLIIFSVLFIICGVYFYKAQLKENKAQMVFLTNIEEINTSEYSLDSFFVASFNEDNSTQDIDKSLNQVQNKSRLININTAPKDILMTLPGIGESIAKNIIEYRQENGNFKNIYEIKNVKRIGEKIYEQIKDLITIGGENDL